MDVGPSMSSAHRGPVTSRHTAPPSTRTFAPLSTQPSSRLRLLVGFFAISGGFAVLSAVVVVMAVLANRLDIGVGRPTLLWSAPLFFLAGLAWLAIARLLHHQRRAARWWALAALLLPVLNWLQGTAMTVGGLLLMLVGVLLVASVWGELRGRDGRAE